MEQRGRKEGRKEGDQNRHKQAVLGTGNKIIRNKRDARSYNGAVTLHGWRCTPEPLLQIQCCWLHIWSMNWNLMSWNLRRSKSARHSKCDKYPCKEKYLRGVTSSTTFLKGEKHQQKQIKHIPRETDFEDLKKKHALNAWRDYTVSSFLDDLSTDIQYNLLSYSSLWTHSRTTSEINGVPLQRPNCGHPALPPSSSTSISARSDWSKAGRVDKKGILTWFTERFHCFRSKCVYLHL